MSKAIEYLVLKIIKLESENKRLRAKVKKQPKEKDSTKHVGFKKYD
jgi:hypothetical protein